MADTGPTAEDYLAPEARARVAIDRMLVAAGWAVQKYTSVNLTATRGVAVREFVMKPPHGRADYLLFLDGRAAGAIEAKPAGATLTGVSWQTGKYADGLPDALPELMRPLPFLYQATGVETRFTNLLDPDAASRQVFAFHRPETLQGWFDDAVEDNDRPTLRARLRMMPRLDPEGLWPAQVRAIHNTERLLAENRPRVLIQMATGSGKTFTAANLALRLVKHAKANRVLFLVDRANLGKQTLKEFQAFTIPETRRKFTDEYVVQHLRSNSIDSTARVVITTIQRLYSILRGEPDLDPELDETSPYDLVPPAPVPVEYNAAVPPEMFDVVVVDECHRSIYGLWRQVLDYFDSFLIGLTATPNKQAFGFFNQCLASEYTHEQAVADGVNVDFDVYRIRTEISERGATIDAGLVTGFRDRSTRAMRWEQVDEEIDYGANQLDRAVVARDQIRTVFKTFRERLFTDIFPGRRDVPKTLIFAKDDSHADDIVQLVREEFGKGDDWAVKITYKSTGRKPDDMIAEFRNSYLPRVAVTVDMIATGTDVKPLECVFFMRSVRSRTFFEQMKGRGVRVINDADFQAVTPDASAKTRFVIVDPVGVTDNDDFAETKPLERLPTQALEALLRQVSFGNRDQDVLRSVASRLARLDRQLTKDDREELEALAGCPLGAITGALVEAVDPDRQYAAAQAATGKVDPTAEEIALAAKEMLDAAAAPLATNPVLREKLIEVRRSYEQTIDETSKDRVIDAGYSVDAADRARTLVTSFKEFIETHRDEITALEVLYTQPHSQRPTFKEIKELANVIGRPPRSWTPERLWEAYEALDRSRVRGSGQRTLTDIVSLVRFALEQEEELVPYPERVNERFDAWLLAQCNAARSFTDEQLDWLGRIRDHLATSLAVTPDDFAYTPFVEHGGLGRAYDLFGGRLNDLLDELTEALVGVTHSIPDGWSWATLEDLAAPEPRSITDGPFGSNLKTEHYTEDGPRVIRLQNIGDGRFIDEESHISRVRFERLRSHEAVAGDVVIAALGEVLPRACVVPSSLGPAIVKADCARVRLHQEVNPAWVVAVLNSPAIRESVTAEISGVGRPRMPLGKTRKLCLPVPPASEQLRIVAAIDEQSSRLDNAVGLIKSALRRLPLIRRAVLGDVMPEDLPAGWKLLTVEEVGMVELGRQRSPKYHSGPNMKPYLRVANVHEDRIDLGDVKEMDFPPEQLARHELRPGDILLNEGQSPEFVGRPAMYRGEMPGVCFTNSLIRFRPFDFVDGEYALLVFLRHLRFGRFQREAQITTNIAHMAAGRFKRVEFPVPPLDEQRDIVLAVRRQLSLLDAFDTELRTALGRSVTLRRAILAAAFRGELVPQDPTDEPAAELLARIASERPVPTCRTRQKNGV